MKACPRENGEPEKNKHHWIPACAGMTVLHGKEVDLGGKTFLLKEDGF